MFARVKVAAISREPIIFDMAGDADRLEADFRDAAANGAQLAVGQEGALGGNTFPHVLFNAVPAERVREIAITLRSPWIDRFRDLAREIGMCLVFGFTEKVGKEVYNAAIFIDHTGNICGKHRKMLCARGHHKDWWFQRMGKQARAFDTPFGRCGILICNDRHIPELTRIMVLDGARYLLIPTFGSKALKSDDNVLARSRENGVPVVQANVGRTLIVSKGEIVAQQRKNKTITYGEIDIPVVPSPRNRNAQEKEFLAWRKEEHARRFQTKLKGVNPVK